MRAGQSQSLLHTVRRLEPSERDAIVARAGAQVVDAIDSTLPVAWLPMRIHMALSDAIRDVVGPLRNVELWRRTMTTSFQRPLLRGFVMMATSLFGMTPFAFLRNLPAISQHITRDLGTLDYIARGPSSGVVTLRAFPAKQFRFVCYVEGVKGCLLSGYDIAKAAGSVIVAGQNEQVGSVDYELQWEARAGGTTRE